MINNGTNFEQRVKIEKKTLVRFLALTLPLVSAIFVTTMPFQAASAQITPAQQQALKSMVATGYTNQFPLQPPHPYWTNSHNVSISYSINLGQVVTMAPDSPRTSLDVILSSNTTPIGTWGIYDPNTKISTGFQKSVRR